VKISGLRKNVELAEAEFANACDGLGEAHFQFKTAVTASIRSRLIETATPFVGAVRQSMAIDASLRLDLGGLHHNRLSEPTDGYSSAGGFHNDLRIDPNEPDNFAWQDDAESMTVCSALDQIGQTVFEAKIATAKVFRDRGERQRREQETEHDQRVAAHGRVFGINQPLQLNDPLVNAELARTA
jgi:hypothetical protein